MLQQGETLSDTGAVASGEAVRWVIGEASSDKYGSADAYSRETKRPRHPHQPRFIQVRQRYLK
jgi:hypothetical protein